MDEAASIKAFPPRLCRSWAALGSYWQKTKFICGLLWLGTSVTGKEVEEIMDSLAEVSCTAGTWQLIVSKHFTGHTWCTQCKSALFDRAALSRALQRYSQHGTLSLRVSRILPVACSIETHGYEEG